MFTHDIIVSSLNKQKDSLLESHRQINGAKGDTSNTTDSNNSLTTYNTTF
jgi:hypothetical protein